MSRSVTPLDGQIGKRLRYARHTQGMTQTDLAQQCGIKFQQIQKYETGVNRISASRLAQVSKVLGVPITYFFDDAPDQAGNLLTKEEARCLLAFRKLPDNQRRSSLNLLKSMAG